jgi:phosphatidylserine/phosphatidylglycerophosphate/cardiolipin synthase-like enzyme
MGKPLGRVEFGGPDLPPRRLRDLLQQHVDRSQPGGRIDWATYYFRDRALAEALMRASDRGVKVRLVLEPIPRREGANDQVIDMLKAHGLAGGFHLRSPVGRDGAKGHLHAKIYAFSHPDIAWVGSFNPSGDVPEDPEVIAEIGDQDRGHNLLVGIERPRLVRALRRYIDELISPSRLPLWARLSSYWRIRDGGTRLYFYPRIATQLVELRISLLGRSARLRAAISHLKKGPLTKALARAARRAADLKLLVHDTERRVSPKAFAFLEEAGVRIRRVAHAEDLPMHAKFILITSRRKTTAWLGSYNFNDKSRLHNAELLMSTTDPAVVDSLSRRFEKIAEMTPEEAV